MNKAITDGAVFMPPAFAGGLDMWSSQDGTPGQDTYENALNAALVPADQDFGGCLELQKVDATQKLRYMGETPLLPGCYLRITARVKAVSGDLPGVRVAAWAGGAGGQHVGGLTERGPTTALTQHGEVVEVSAIVGAGARCGVDMAWGREPLYGHFGIDLRGPSGGIVRVDDIVIEDVTHVVLRDMMGWVDVRDYGAIGDGTSDDLAAFEAADADADGRRVVVPAGIYHLGDSMSFENEVRFEGTVTMPDAAILDLTRDFHLPAYLDAFGSEELAFKKAFQVLLNGEGHETLDMGGLRVEVTAPVDMQAATPNRTTYATRRMIRNGQFEAKGDAVWHSDVVTSQATYSVNDSKTLTGVVNVASIAVGSLVTGSGVGREIYVRAVNVATQEVELNRELYDAEGTQTFTFTRFKYLLDFSGFDRLGSFALADIKFRCNSKSSGICLAPGGVGFALRDCFFTRPLQRAITSPGEGCQGLLVDRCHFLSNENDVLAQDRVSIVLNAAGNDVKLRDNHATRFRHFAVLGGTGPVITGNHLSQSDNATQARRTAGIVIGEAIARAKVDGNHIDNCFLEWTNEYGKQPTIESELPFSQLNITDNVFLCSDTVPRFSFIVVKPHGSGHSLNHVVVQGNSFRTIGGGIERVERVDTSFADLDYAKFKNVSFAGNMYNLVDVATESPLLINHVEACDAQIWTVDGAPKLPFGGRARNVESVQPIGAIRNAAGTPNREQPFVNLATGINNGQVEIHWSEPVHGEVAVKIRVD
ncbi:glycosyl hydrolase family 28-related protein [Alisedimentitalea sp. MJ-SS2]|uniref:glycosyl hydrolase family 28-related protein n=1 Tax=Aliisedimentitalea sp. MJ-SS2 TaxID=3049795 RepID=UPI00291058CC|nr:glycosyl hydrolase family 28-related protein [Alisedimentitalea sp. MJ-SS2]MDU8927157.1 glycosyl hydrolase family 28-related protein [Alisedimentitalea sp. MJ-SS2]